MNIYNFPLYYDIAFSFVDPKKQVENFGKIIKKFSSIKVKSCLDIACGPSPQLIELAKRGYKAIGLDISQAMINYLLNEAKKQQVKVGAIRGDMRDFKLERKVDFSFIMMGSFTFSSKEDLLKHLDSVAKNLRKGGLYLIQNQLLDWQDNSKQSWVMKRGDIKIKTTFDWFFVDKISQFYKENLSLVVSGVKFIKKIRTSRRLRFFFPQELKTLLENSGTFEFLGWWPGSLNEWYLNKKLERAKKINSNIVVLRRK
ncbi:MAG: class I SAM-dependent methyltransferase [Patescibacteria group bacterium]|jgi:SAM-dependent methyltransferase